MRYYIRYYVFMNVITLVFSPIKEWNMSISYVLKLLGLSIDDFPYSWSY